jgi:Flp pilus assembly protein TadG
MMGWFRKIVSADNLRRLWVDRSGVGAVEFALIAPLLLMIYLTVFELTIGLSVSKRVAKASGTIADLVTQQDSVDKQFLGTMLDVADSIFVPYGLNDISMNITGISVDGTNPKVLWSWDQSGGKPYPFGNTVEIPEQMKVAGSFVVHAEVWVPHQLLMFMPGLIPSRFRNITIRRDYYFRARTGDKIACNGC